MARKAKRIVYRVRFDRRSIRWRWEIRTPAGILACHETQAEAVREAIRTAHSDRAEGRLAQVVLHGRNGRVRWERTYGRDPARTRG